MRLGWFYLRPTDTTAFDPSPALSEALVRAGGVTDVIPSYDSVFVEFDADVTSEDRLRAFVSTTAASGARGTSPLDPNAADGPNSPFAAVPAQRESRTVTIPVVYGGSHGPDLVEAAAVTGMSEERVAELHRSVEYRVAALGFMPGFAFMTGVPDALRLPRRPAPRPAVPAHSVAVANEQAGVYPLESPGGWNLLGRATVAMYDPHRDEPFLVRPGDGVRFVAARTGEEPPPSPGALDLLPTEPRHPSLMVLEPGLLDLIVDRGRLRVGRFGLARGGPLDARTAELANRLIGNPLDAALLELSVIGPVLEALRPTVVAVTGDALVPFVDGIRREPWSSVALRRGQVLSFEPGASGSRAYLALSGGIDVGLFAGSATTDLRGLLGRALRAGDVLGASHPHHGAGGRTFKGHARSSPEVRVRIVAGPQANDEALEALTRNSFGAARGDRTGLMLDGPAVPGGEVVSEGVPIGAVQVTSGGSPIVLLHDRGTLGGYHKPAVVHPADLGLVAQMRPGQRLRFTLTEVDRTVASSTRRPSRLRAR